APSRRARRRRGGRSRPPLRPGNHGLRDSPRARDMHRRGAARLLRGAPRPVQGAEGDPVRAGPAARAVRKSSAPQASRPGFDRGVTFDYVVVGGGTAGCVLANRLTADGRHRVLLLEAGPVDRSPWIHIPIGYAKTMFHPRYNWGFRTDPEPQMDSRAMYWPRGRCLGGSSSINGLIYIRGQPEDYDRWLAQGGAGWGWKDVRPFFIRMEHNTRGASEWHGADGPQWCSDIGRPHELMEAIARGAAELGVPRNDDFNGARQEGVGYYQLFTRRGWRCSTASGYLRPARNRPNLEVSTEAHV